MKLCNLFKKEVCYLSVFCELCKVFKSTFIQKSARTWEIEKDLQKEIASAKGNWQRINVLKSVMREVY